MRDDLERVLKELKLNVEESSHARILTVLWPGEWITIEQIMAENKGQSDTPRRIRELKKEFGFEIKQEGTGKRSKYCLGSHKYTGERRRKYLSKHERELLVKCEGLECNICGKTACKVIGNLQIDHRIPFERNGPSTLENSQLLCVECNVMKKRICEHCHKNNCENCAYAYPERYKNSFLLNLSPDLKSKCDKIAYEKNISLDSFIEYLISEKLEDYNKK